MLHIGLEWNHTQRCIETTNPIFLFTKNIPLPSPWQGEKNSKMSLLISYKHLCDDQ